MFCKYTINTHGQQCEHTLQAKQLIQGGQGHVQVAKHTHTHVHVCMYTCVQGSIQIYEKHRKEEREVRMKGKQVCVCMAGSRFCSVRHGDSITPVIL